MKNVLFAAVIAFAAPSMAATLVLKDGKVPAGAKQIVTVVMDVKSDLDFKGNADGSFGATVQNQEISGTLIITQNGRTESQAMGPTTNVTQQVGTLKLGKDSITLTDATGKAATMKASIKREGGRLTIKVSDKDSLASAQKELGAKIKELAAEPMIISLSLSNTGLVCEGDNSALTCTMKVSVKGTMGE